jgi:hypothetical protein
MTTWQMVWRKGFAPFFSTRALLALQKALEKDDLALIQGATIDLPPIPEVADWPITAACAVAYAGWQGEGLETVESVEEFFAKACFQADQTLGECGACRWFLAWYDETPRPEMRRLLLEEIKVALAERGIVSQDSAVA